MINKSVIWWFVVLAGTLPIGTGLQYFVGGEGYHNTQLRNLAVIGQIVLGLAIIGFGLVKVVRSRESEKVEIEKTLKITE